MGEMATAISAHLNHDMDKVVPTVIVMVTITCTLLGLAFFMMGYFRLLRGVVKVEL